MPTGIPPGLEPVLRRIWPIQSRVRQRLGKAVYAPRAHLRTDDHVLLEELGLAGPDRSKYSPIGWSVLPRILPTSEVSANDVFIDYGCGMGRAVYLAASRYAFKRVIGVELSPVLADIARENLDRNARPVRCQDVRLDVADVLHYEPDPDVSVAFLHNPFQGRTFELVTARLLDRTRGRLRIIYANPVEHDRLMATGRFREVRRLRGRRPSREWSHAVTTVMYEAVGR